MGWRIKRNPRNDITIEEQIRRSNSQRRAKVKMKAKKKGEDYHTPVIYTPLEKLVDIQKLKRICSVYYIFWNDFLKGFKCEICGEFYIDISAQIARKHWESKHKGK